MLEIIVPAAGGWDERKEEFVDIGTPYKLTLEHSLISISKWEAKYHKPFLNTDKTNEEINDYVRFMTVGPVPDDSVYRRLSRENIDSITAYINNPMTATTFLDKDNQRKEGEPPKKKKVITSEEIYYWMVAQQIPFNPCQKWHINRLLTLIRVCSEKNKSEGDKKMPKKDALAYRKKLNAERKARHHSKG